MLSQLKSTMFSKTNSPQQDCSLLPSTFKYSLFVNLETKQSSQAVYIKFFDQLSSWGFAHFSNKTQRSCVLPSQAWSHTWQGMYGR
jgi:hypothetical protein